MPISVSQEQVHGSAVLCLNFLCSYVLKELKKQYGIKTSDGFKNKVIFTHNLEACSYTITICISGYGSLVLLLL